MARKPLEVGPVKGPRDWTGPETPKRDWTPENQSKKDVATRQVAGLKRGWCKFSAKRRCYVEGVLLERPGQTICLSAEASLRVKHNKHLLLVAGELPETKRVEVLDLYGDPLKRAGEIVMKDVVADEELLELDGDPIVGEPPPDFADEQYAMKHALVTGKKMS